MTIATTDGSPLFDGRFGRSDDPSIWTDRRRQLLKWFRQEAPTLAGPYEGAVWLFAHKGFPGQLHFVCHVVRDIYRLLPEVLDHTRSRIEPTHAYPKLLDDVKKHWPKSLFGPNPDKSTEEPPFDFMPIPRPACQAVEKALQMHAEVNQQASSDKRLVELLFRLHPTHRANVPERLIDVFKRERHWFTRRAHLSANPTASSDDLTEHFERFELALFSFGSSRSSGWVKG